MYGIIKNYFIIQKTIPELRNLIGTFAHRINKRKRKRTAMPFHHLQKVCDIRFQTDTILRFQTVPENPAVHILFPCFPVNHLTTLFHTCPLIFSLYPFCFSFSPHLYFSDHYSFFYNYFSGYPNQYCLSFCFITINPDRLVNKLTGSFTAIRINALC